jgi:hypothetical protein
LSHRASGYRLSTAGYEWTSNTGGNNLHRNVIFRDNGEKASRVVLYTTLAPAASRVKSFGQGN